MRKLSIVIAVVFTAGGLLSLHAQQKPSASSTGGAVTMLEQPFKAAIAYARFDPGARTKWHTHEGGQIVLVEEGIGHTQVKGGPVIELRAGESIYVGPGVMHWHGSAPDASCVQYNVSRGGSTFGDEVTDQEYRAAPRK